jgi:multiple sugar transport system permease protein
MSMAGSRRKRIISTGLVYVGLVTLLIIFIGPLLWVLGLSLKTRAQIFVTPPVLFWTPTFEHYARVLTQADFISSFMNSITVTSASVALSLVIGVPASYVFARFRFFGSGAVFYTLLLMRMLPPVAILLPIFILFTRLGLANSRIGLIIAYTTFSLPLIVWIMRDFFEGLPKELEEAAYIDGASKMATFLRIVLPLARPGIVTASILCLLLAWNDFVFAAILTNNATRTLPVLMATYAGAETGTDWGSMTASGVLVVIPVIIFSLLVQRHLVAGLSAGSVK